MKIEAKTGTKIQPLPREAVARLISTNERGAAAIEAKKVHGLLETLLTSSNSFNVHFAILLMFSCIWPTVSNACATTTNSIAHAHVGSKVIEILDITNTLN